MTAPQPTPSTQPTERVRRGSSLPDLPLIIEQLQDQIDQLHATVAAQQTIIEQHTARLTALEPH